MLIMGRILGVVALFMAIIHFFFPKTLRPLDDLGKKTMVSFVEIVEKHRIAFGVFYFLAGATMLYYAR
jgi:uncharacterized membrane protein